MADNRPKKPTRKAIPIDNLDFEKSRLIIERLFPDAKFEDIPRLMQLYGVAQQKRKAHGGPVKKYAKGGGVRKAKYG